MALQDVIGGLANPTASRQAILQRLGIDPTRAAGYGGNTQFDQSMADLYRQGLQGSANLDVEEGNLNRNYQQSLAQSAVDRDKALKALQGSYAQRGMTFSGANVEDVANTTGEYNRYNENLGEDFRAGTGAVGRNRLNLEYGLGAGRQALEGGYGNDLQAFLQQQALAMFAAVVDQNRQNAMMQSMQSQQQAPAPARAPAPVYRAPAPVARPAPAPPRTSFTSNVGWLPQPKPALKGQGYAASGKRF